MDMPHVDYFSDSFFLNQSQTLWEDVTQPLRLMRNKEGAHGDSHSFDAYIFVNGFILMTTIPSLSLKRALIANHARFVIGHRDGRPAQSDP